MSKQNRGPAASAENRAALMASARKLFASEGLNVPFSAIAKDAGVSQGVLYRHFSSLIDLAVAVFEENLDSVEQSITDRPAGQLGFEVCWARLVQLTISDAAFIQTAVHASTELRLRELSVRIQNLTEPLLEEAIAEGLLQAGTTYDTLALTLRAIYGLVATSPDNSAEPDVSNLLDRLGLPNPL